MSDELTAAGFRVAVDGRSARINANIRDAQLRKIPYMLVAGNKEEQISQVSVRPRTNDDRGMTDSSDLVDHLREVVGTKSGL